MLHIHNFADICTIQNILVSYEKSEITGEYIEKKKPKFVKSFSKIICHIQACIPVALEKYDVIPQLGCFTLRNGGYTIASGKVLRYKPVIITGETPATLDFEIESEDTRKSKHVKSITEGVQEILRERFEFFEDWE